MILKHLKTQTATLHQKTEEDNLAKFILDHSIDVATYTQLLQQNYLAYARIDRILEANSASLDDNLKVYADAAKSKALAEDLTDLDAEIPQVESTTVQFSSAYLLGLIYVVEGSMMGGLLIRKNLESCEHLKDKTMHHFFGKSAPEVMQRWKNFTGAVEEKTYSEQEHQEAVDGAHAAFMIFKDSYSYA